MPEAGRVSGGGSNLKTIYKYPGKAKNVTLEVPVDKLARPIAVRVRVGFVPKAKGKKTSTAYATCSSNRSSRQRVVAGRLGSAPSRPGRASYRFERMAAGSV